MRSTQTAEGFIRRLMSLIRQNIALGKEEFDKERTAFYHEKVLGGIPYYSKARPSRCRKKKTNKASAKLKNKHRSIRKSKYGR